jgi:hypothetical protein
MSDLDSQELSKYVMLILSVKVGCRRSTRPQLLHVTDHQHHQLTFSNNPNPLVANLQARAQRYKSDISIDFVSTTTSEQAIQHHPLPQL